MARFGIIKVDEKVFTGDKLRIDVSESFITPDETFATISHEVSTDGGATWYNVTAKKYVDWIFTTAGVKTISLRITTSSGNDVFTKTSEVLNITTQKLFSKDHDLYAYETDIDQYLPKKWSSWNMVHLNAQKYIMDWLDEKRIFKASGAKYVVADLHDLDQVRQFSIFKTLEFIFESNVKVVDDYFSTKRDHYRQMATEKASKSQIALDYNNDGVNNDNTERTDLHSVGVSRE